MGVPGVSVYKTDNLLPSKALRRVVSGFTETAVVVLDTGHGGIALSSFPVAQRKTQCRRRPALPESGPGELREFSSVALDERDIQALDATVGSQGAPSERGGWKAFSCRFQDGSTDRIALQLDPAQDAVFTRNFLEKIWPVLREDCLAEAGDMQITFGNEALLWMISDRIDVAVLVLDSRSRMLRINSAARELLDAGRVLRRGRGGVFGHDEKESHRFRSAVLACARAEKPAEGETILFLQGDPHGIRVPVSLSRYYHQGEPTDLVVVMLPMPPDPARVEMLGRKMGLSPSEARVAALMQTGLTNREAASRAGLKEQTFNTYAKRVMNKLQVHGRTEMAQLLTWQAAGRRIA